MQNKCLDLLQLGFVLSLLSRSEAQDVIGSGHSCVRSNPAEDGQTRITFLREDTAGARSLYVTLWSEDMRLVTCEINFNPLVTESYSTLCNRSSQEITQRFINVSMLLAPDAPCALNSSAPKITRRTRRDGREERKSRRKRAWTFPGTLWCGTGSKAVRYEQLGMFESADRCCREHDHCLHIIPVFTVNYGVFNSNLFTVSHCDCDQRFRQCLLGVNDTISSMVGYSFFNILRVPCFELKKQKRCTKMYWWGMCKVAKEAPYAVFKNPLPYDTTHVTSEYGDNTDSNMSTSSKRQHVTESPEIILHRKSPKGEHRCKSRDPPRGDTFYRRRTKGKGCNRRQKLSPVPPSQRADTTTPSMKAGLMNTSKSSTLVLNKKRIVKKKRTRKGLSPYCTQKTQFLSQATINSPRQTTSTTQSTLALTQRPALRQHLPTPITAAAKTMKRHKKTPKKSCCCGSRMHAKGDIFRPHCKHCQEQKTTVRPSTATNGLTVKVTLSKTTESPKQDTLKGLWTTATSATSVTTKLKTATSFHKDGKDSHLLWTNTRQEPVGKTIAQSIHAQRNMRENNALHNMTDNQLLCESLKYLDECKYKIPPLEKKYDLQNMETKTAYHCDCTSRWAVQIESFKQPSSLSSLLVDFVSQYCFKLPKKKKHHSRKSCCGGFTKASDLLQALKKIEEKDTAGVRNSGNERKRGIPVRLYKRCLRLEREANNVTQLT
ncbi:group 3 secretory phospholipase A2-like [Thunnus maccoyii]|uniref:group 3 secretory phospholipase A2-like n=1 Tax=Thunnus maccoyii TaxID=8240 RepID=UPI001C4BA06E|nr:group 3 secretory phospholipase A2-like [Thunnus maccoyii]